MYDFNGDIAEDDLALAKSLGFDGVEDWSWLTRVETSSIHEIALMIKEVSLSASRFIQAISVNCHEDLSQSDARSLTDLCRK